MAASRYSTKETRKGDESHPKHLQSSNSTLRIFCQVEKQLEKVFLHYSSGKKELGFEQLTHLLYDFDVFPAFVTKSRLFKLFQEYGHSQSKLGELVGQISLSLQ